MMGFRIIIANDRFSPFYCHQDAIRSQQGLSGAFPSFLFSSRKKCFKHNLHRRFYDHFWRHTQNIKTLGSAHLMTILFYRKHTWAFFYPFLPSGELRYEENIWQTHYTPIMCPRFGNHLQKIASLSRRIEVGKCPWQIFKINAVSICQKMSFSHFPSSSREARLT